MELKLIFLQPQFSFKMHSKQDSDIIEAEISKIPNKDVIIPRKREREREGGRERRRERVYQSYVPIF